MKNGTSGTTHTEKIVIYQGLFAVTALTHNFLIKRLLLCTKK